MSKHITVYGVSDMTGETVERIVRAASAQFPAGEVTIKMLQHASDAQQVIDFIEQQGDTETPTAVFHTILSPRTRADLRSACQTLRIPSIDLLGPAVTVISTLTGIAPSHEVGAVYRKR